MSERVTFAIDGGVADIRLSRPEKRNTLDREMFTAIIAAAERVAADRAVRGVVLSGEGKGFCAGLDISLFAAMAESGNAPELVVDGLRVDGAARGACVDGARGAGDRRGPRGRGRRRIPTRAGRRHPHRRPRRAARRVRDPVGHRARHVRHPTAAAARGSGRGQGAHLHRPHRQRRRGAPDRARHARATIRAPRRWRWRTRSRARAPKPSGWPSAWSTSPAAPRSPTASAPSRSSPRGWPAAPINSKP